MSTNPDAILERIVERVLEEVLAEIGADCELQQLAADLRAEQWKPIIVNRDCGDEQPEGQINEVRS